MFKLPGSGLLPAFTLFCLTVPGARALGDRLYSVSPFDANLHVVDPFTAKTIASVPITAPGVTVLQSNGLAAHPTTGELWALLTLTGTPGRFLAKIDPATGAATLAGNTGDKFAGLAFDAAGTLYAVTGDGATTPETLFTLNLANGTPTQVMALGNGSAGETMAWHPRTARILHASGQGTQNREEILETVDPVAKVVTNVPLSGDDYEEALGMTWWVGDNFLLADIPNDLYVVSASGVASMIGTLDHNSKGLAFVQTTSGARFEPYGNGCPGSGGYAPVLAGSGTPTPSSTITVGVVNGRGGSPGVLLLGLGQGTLPITPGCTVQNLPLLPFVTPVTLASMGPGKGRLSLPMQIPPGTAPGDVFFQVVLFEGATPLVTNPLRIHIQ